MNEEDDNIDAACEEILQIIEDYHRSTGLTDEQIEDVLRVGSLKWHAHLDRN